MSGSRYKAGGITEYWLLGPQRRWAEFYRLEGDRYRLAFAGAERYSPLGRPARLLAARRMAVAAALDSRPGRAARVVTDLRAPP